MPSTKFHQPENISIEQLVNGNEQAFSMIFAEYSPQVYYIGIKYLKSEDLANDVVQDTFLKLWNYRTHIDTSKPIKPLIVTFAKRVILNMIRDEKRKILKHVEILARKDASSNLTEDEVLFNETNKVYQEAIKSLPEKRKAVFLMKTMQGLSNEEVAEELGLSVNTVKSHYTKGLKTVQDFVSKYYGLIAVAIVSSETL
ncbi:DNA-directed RNA polymerase sigma-70 factor [Echinicola pacifica]|uniref:DNA-directed RNA polymerase sigma-70 factor n=1 Tax=Echinicola pacifica TaxID=346377 RepID=A0A918PKS7_9BACT|nr:RNA polymerase sigma-70 factor [Echinicola pacifica]GGZ13880.1 DNA-directed RNA polymerase sigma-70 factor [Echinicola pacifica]